MPILSESQIRQSTPRDKAYKIYDSGGLYLKVSTSGAKLWRFKYHFGRVERLLVIGKYPGVTLTRPVCCSSFTMSWMRRNFEVEAFRCCARRMRTCNSTR
jgi:hypothetical protein